MDKPFVLAVGGAALDQQLEFVALAVVVDNPTNQWVRLNSLGVTVPQYTLGATYPLPGTSRAQLSFTAPAGQVEPPTIAGQSATATFYSFALPLTAGVGMLGGRAPYYDRNPLSLVFTYFFNNISPHGATTRWSYTVPSGRRAYVETGQSFVQLEAAGDIAVTNLVGYAESWVGVTPVAGSGSAVALANVQDLAPVRAWGGALVGASIEVQPADIVFGATINTYTATKATHLVKSKITEFDA